MSRNIYALLVGINEYTPEVGRLAGCVNDVDNFHAYLADHFKKDALAVEMLKDGDATRDNIIKQFRSHLGKASSGDVAIFQYCGHGARWSAAKEFHEFYPDGKDEGLVCFDSRTEGGAYPFDLADKELALLLSELAANDPHIAVLLDCCHSGSATRDADSMTHLKTRQTHEVFQERPLDSYLDGYYAQRKKKGAALSIPRSKHILLAACDRKQKAFETKDRSGLFTSIFLNVLDKSGSDISYADLFMRCRAEMRKEVDNQTPQFEALEHFNAFSGVFGGEASHDARRYSVYFKNGDWTVDCGALHGLPTDPEKNAAFALYPEDAQETFAGRAQTIQVGAQKSELKLDFTGDESARYYAEMTSLPAAPLPVYVDGDEQGKEALRKSLNPSVGVELTDSARGASYGISAKNGEFLLKRLELDQLIQGVKGAGYSEESAQTMHGVVKKVAQWERSLALQNKSARLDASQVDFVYAEDKDDGQEHIYPEGEIALDFRKVGEDWPEIRGKIKVRNRTSQELHFVLAYFSPAYGIYILRNDPAPPGESYFTLWGEDEEDYFYLDDEENEIIVDFKLIVSTERVDDFLLTQDELELGEFIELGGASRGGLGTVKPRRKIIRRNDWFTKSMRVRVVRQLDQAGANDAALANGKIVIKGHPNLKGNLSLAAAKTASRSVGDGDDFYKAFERQGLQMMNFAGTRGDSESILEITDIENDEALAENPLEIDLNVPLDENEGILPLVYDGEHVMLGGDVHKDDSGNTHISIDHIPEVPDNRRSLGKALKLYFFKTYLKHDNVNQLCWVELKDDGTVARRKSGVAEKVSEAQNVAVLVHGIIGDTQVIAEGLHQAKLNEDFDLVLTFDYENLSTPISKTALDLKKKLAAVGFGKDDNKKLTVLAHSMGGLASRWFIEREGGNAMVDHLVMCGTPNNGSPFGKIETARKIFKMLTGVAMNYIPALVPFNGALMFLLNRSKKITPTLEQMNPSSDFMTELNSSDDPGVRYTILAGNVEEYEEPSDQFFPKMLAKAGQGIVMSALFGSGTHDIAVSVDSIIDVSDKRNPAPKQERIACHHLNYFISEVGQKALKEVSW